jgi:acyl carrier protein
VIERIQAAAAANGTSLAGLDDEFNIVDSGVLDSIGFIDLITSIEDQFDLEIDLSEADPDEFTTLAGLVDVCTSPDAQAGGEDP